MQHKGSNTYLNVFYRLESGVMNKDCETGPPAYRPFLEVLCTRARMAPSRQLARAALTRAHSFSGAWDTGCCYQISICEFSAE